MEQYILDVTLHAVIFSKTNCNLLLLHAVIFSKEMSPRSLPEIWGFWNLLSEVVIELTLFLAGKPLYFLERPLRMAENSVLRLV